MCIDIRMDVILVALVMSRMDDSVKILIGIASNLCCGECASVIHPE